MNKKEDKVVEEMRHFINKVDEGVMIEGELEQYLKGWLKDIK